MRGKISIPCIPWFLFSLYFSVMAFVGGVRWLGMQSVPYPQNQLAISFVAKLS